MISIENVRTAGGNDTIAGSSDENYITAAAGDDVVEGRGGADHLDGGTGVDTLSYAGSSAGVVVAINGAASGGDAQGDVLLNFENLYGSNYNDSLAGDGGVNALFGSVGADTLKGAGGADRLDGGTGVDSMQGGADNDVYVVDSASDVVDELAFLGSGIDTVETAITLDMSNAATFKGDVENLTLTGAAAINGTGNALDNLITGNEESNILTGAGGSDILVGGAGNDVLRGGAGNDVYVIDGLTDRVNESIAGSDGVDTVQTTFSFSLANTTVILGDVENLTLLGTDDINATGNALANLLIGNVGANLLTGGAGTDTLMGGAGADTMRGGANGDVYYVDDLADVVDESVSGSGGVDTIVTAMAYDLASPATEVHGSIENLILTGADNIDGKGTNAANVLTGNAGVNTLDGREGADTLDGGAGADVMIGGLGDDVYYVSITEDQTVEAKNAGTDLVYSTTTYSLAHQWVENLTLTGSAAADATGNSLANVLTGNVGNNVLDGSTGADTMAGGAGSDTYYVDNSGDRVSEADVAGSDIVYATVSFSIAGQYVENLVLTGSADTDGTGNSLNNRLTGSSGDNLLSGRDGADTLSGGVGNDTLDGGDGADRLTGGVGSDTFIVDTNADVVMEARGQGAADTVIASATFTLNSAAEIEVMKTTDAAATTAINLNGNSFAQSLTGNAGANALNGGGGADTMTGGAGSDTYTIDNAGDVVIEANVSGVDTVNASVTFSLAHQFVENLTLTGAAAIDATGNSLDNVLTGNAGVNVLTGGTGDDDYYVQTVGDKAVEANGQGDDRVLSSVSYSLAGQYIERLRLTGDGDVNATGNSLKNTIAGNDHDNILDGMTGADRIAGGAGHDAFVFSTTLGSSNVDAITDFSAADDTMRLGQSVFAGLALGALSADAFHLGTAAADASDRIIFNNTTGALFFDRDGTGATYKAVQFATLENHATITAADFTII
ncbi:beta strand repeat-containing protein [Hansschlegelia plantiphila]|uniref:Hemolysin D n=1 Tax=Hansschlegelia plantiphila TaxID=374655 RepID=A0A9W6MV86_9HYPH|nr:hypothetical protein [Hansschlegelia plantiphila]GLK67631.1 hemolysin D [Hansschlegelia plantiphila]